jgi:phage-related tail fiber protein
VPLTRITAASLSKELKDDNQTAADADITAIAKLSDNAVGYLKKIGANDWAIDSATFLTSVPVQTVFGRVGNVTLQSGDVTSALSFTPYNATNPNNFINANQNITVTGDATGSGTTAIALTLPNIATAGTYRSLTINAKGQVTAGTNPTTLAGYGITDAQALNAKLTTYSAFATAGMLAWTSTAGAMAARTLTAGTGITVTNGNGTAGNPTVAITAVGTAGTYRSVTTNASGQVTAGTNPTTLAGYGITDSITAATAASTYATKATTLSGYAITDAYTKTEVDTALSGKQASLGFTPYNATNPAGYQTASDVSTSVQALIGAAPAALDTLAELAAALGNDANYSASITTSLSNKADKTTTYTKTEVDTALSGKQASLGFIPYNATNPTGYITSAEAPVQSVNGSTGIVTVSPASISAINTNQLAVASGVATLDATGKLLTAQRPVLTANEIESAQINTGAVIQTVSAVVAATTGTSTVTLNNTVPASTTGTQIWTSTITPNSTSSHINVSGAFTFVSGTASRILMAFVFRGTTCIGTFGIASTATVTPYNLKIEVVDSPATTAATTYSVRVAVTSAATWYINQFATAYFGGTLALSTISLHELA